MLGAGAHGFYLDVWGVAFPANRAHEAPVTRVNGGRGANPTPRAPTITKSHSKL